MSCRHRSTCERNSTWVARCSSAALVCSIALPHFPRVIDPRLPWFERFCSNLY